MAKQIIQIGSVMNGLSQLEYFSPSSSVGKPVPSYHAAIGIDPDMPINDTSKRLSGYIRPTAMTKISATTITGAPLWIVTNPKDSFGYVYDNVGNTYTIDASLNVTALQTLSGSIGNGAEYYDNGLLFATGLDIARYAPLDGTPTFTTNYWTSTLSKAALSNTAYPTINGVQIPNHPMFRHPTSGVCFIGDVSSNTTANTNLGAIHQIKTKKTTVEGDTDNGSGYNALLLQYGYYPTAIEAYQDTLAVAAIEGVSTTIKQKRATLYFWDMTSTSFSKVIQVEFPDPFITAMKNVNGVLYVWSGNANGGCRLSRFTGGWSYEEVWFSEQGFPPFQGAVDSEMNRVVWGSSLTYPESAVTVMASGSRAEQAGGGVHNILKTTSSGTNGNVTCLKYFQSTALNIRQPIVGWKDDSGQGIDKSSTTYATSVFRSEVWRIGMPFTIKKIRIPLAQKLTANHNATFKIFSDNHTANSIVATITSGVLSGDGASMNNDQNITIAAMPNGQHDFFFEYRTTGTDLLTLALPITIEVETLQD